MRTKNYLIAFIIIGSLTLLASCDADNGIAPKAEKEQVFGFGGNIVFYGVWPDSIKRIILVVFNDPLIDPGDFVITNISYLSFEFPLKVQNYQYST
ncbi:MAG: hypothetical protein KJO12_01015, partial [Ignavibacteria bacterium]|nr:hypothetical protein [Ignavibacteria bacterium]